MSNRKTRRGCRGGEKVSKNNQQECDSVGEPELIKTARKYIPQIPEEQTGISNMGDMLPGQNYLPKLRFVRHWKLEVFLDLEHIPINRPSIDTILGDPKEMYVVPLCDDHGRPNGKNLTVSKKVFDKILEMATPLTPDKLEETQKQGLIEEEPS